jgi:hypothetical protein
VVSVCYFLELLAGGFLGELEEDVEGPLDEPEDEVDELLLVETVLEVVFGLTCVSLLVAGSMLTLAPGTSTW